MPTLPRVPAAAMGVSTVCPLVSLMPSWVSLCRAVRGLYTRHGCRCGVSVSVSQLPSPTPPECHCGVPTLRVTHMMGLECVPCVPSTSRDGILFLPPPCPTCPPQVSPHRAPRVPAPPMGASMMSPHPCPTHLNSHRSPAGCHHPLSGVSPNCASSHPAVPRGVTPSCAPTCPECSSSVCRSVGCTSLCPSPPCAPPLVPSVGCPPAGPHPSASPVGCQSLCSPFRGVSTECPHLSVPPWGEAGRRSQKKGSPAGSRGAAEGTERGRAQEGAGAPVPESRSPGLAAATGRDLTVSQRDTAEIPLNKQQIIDGPISQPEGGDKSRGLAPRGG